MVGHPAHQDLDRSLARPGTGGHLLGTDALGRDVLAWVGGGIRTSLEVSLGVICLSGPIGALSGSSPGYAGGWLDSGLMRIADIQLSIPPLVLFIAASAALSEQPAELDRAAKHRRLGAVCSVCRARVLVQRERGYVLAARLAGRRRAAIALLHLLPGVRAEVTVLASLQAGVVLVWEAGLSFLGLGLQPPYVSLGFPHGRGKAGVISQAWWVAAFPGLALALLIVGFNLAGDGLRDYSALMCS